MIFLDTSAIYAWSDVRDANHQIAVQQLQRILDERQELLTHNYVLLEAISLLQARLGFSAATKLEKDSAFFVIDWVDKNLHASGIREWEKSGRRRVSLVDQISFLVMMRHNVTTAFAFDPHFETAGFKPFGD
jgi:uncharacterized protein